MKRLLVALVVLLALLLVADRGGAVLAERQTAAQLQASSELSSEPDVDVMGFPFLTQALAGRYERVEVTATDVPAGELTLTRLEATLTGVQVPVSQVLSGSVTRVPVDAVRARALVGYDELALRSGDRRLRVAPAEGERVRVTGSLEVLGRTLSATALSRIEVVDGDLVVTAESYEVGSETADALLTRALGDSLDLRIALTGLPYGLQVTDVQVTDEGVVVRANARDTVLSPP